MDPTVIGGIAGFLTSIAVLPQIIKTWKTRHARDLSIWQQIIIILGLALWLCYGLILKDLPLIVSNVFTLACYCLLFVMKIYYDRTGRTNSDDYINKVNHHSYGGSDERSQP